MLSLLLLTCTGTLLLVKKSRLAAGPRFLLPTTSRDLLEGGHAHVWKVRTCTGGFEAESDSKIHVTEVVVLMFSNA